MLQINHCISLDQEDSLEKHLFIHSSVWALYSCYDASEYIGILSLFPLKNKRNSFHIWLIVILHDIVCKLLLDGLKTQWPSQVLTYHIQFWYSGNCSHSFRSFIIHFLFIVKDFEHYFHSLRTWTLFKSWIFALCSLSWRKYLIIIENRSTTNLHWFGNHGIKIPSRLLKNDISWQHQIHELFIHCKSMWRNDYKWDRGQRLVVLVMAGIQREEIEYLIYLGRINVFYIQLNSTDKSKVNTGRSEGITVYCMKRGLKFRIY